LSFFFTPEAGCRIVLPGAKHLEHRTKARRDGRIRGTAGVSTYNQGLCEIQDKTAALNPNEERCPAS
jgi:hypothetical protein